MKIFLQNTERVNFQLTQFYGNHKFDKVRKYCGLSNFEDFEKSSQIRDHWSWRGSELVYCLRGVCVAEKLLKLGGILGKTLEACIFVNIEHFEKRSKICYHWCWGGSELQNGI